jgi:hypothetical protein
MLIEILALRHQLAVETGSSRHSPGVLKSRFLVTTAAQINNG